MNERKNEWKLAQMFGETHSARFHCICNICTSERIKPNSESTFGPGPGWAFVTRVCVVCHFTANFENRYFVIQTSRCKCQAKCLFNIAQATKTRDYFVNLIELHMNIGLACSLPSYVISHNKNIERQEKKVRVQPSSFNGLAAWTFGDGSNSNE